MGFFSTLKALNSYERHVKSLGVNYLAIPTALNGFVRDLMLQECQSTSKSLGTDLTTEDLDASMYLGAEIVAHCLIGPTMTSKRLGANAIVELEYDVFGPWKANGASANVYTRIVDAFMKSGLACREFLDALKTATS